MDKLIAILGSEGGSDWKVTAKQLRTRIAEVLLEK